MSKEVSRLSGRDWETWASSWTKEYVKFKGNRQSESRRRFDLISRLCTYIQEKEQCLPGAGTMT